MKLIFEALRGEVKYLYRILDTDNAKMAYPKIPSNYLVKNGYEDGNEKRASFSTSISNCLSALSYNIEGKTFYVYRIDVSKINPEYIKYTNEIGIDKVPDIELTDECWVIKRVKLEYVSTIKVGKTISELGSYKYGDNKIATLYEWQYDTISGE